MTHQTNSQLDVLNRLATASLWMVIPAGIALGLSIRAFEAVFPPWFFPGGVLFQVLLYIVMFAYVDKGAPQESMHSRIGGLFVFFAPLPLYIVMEGSGVDVDWSEIRRYSPFVAWAFPLILIGVMSLTKSRADTRKA